MTFGIAIHPIIPGRAEPSDKAEMVTQVLFGETYKVLEVQKKWVLIELQTDKYTCWIDLKQHTEADTPVAEPDFLTDRRTGDPFGMILNSEGHRYHIPCGSILHNYQRGDFELKSKTFQYKDRIARHDSESVLRRARRFLHAPYLWGGKTAMGIDCSGLTQVILACAGISIPRDAYLQAEQGESVDFIDLAEPGDLAFFDNEEGRITHVGIITEKSEIIHASGSVRFDTLDHQGIYNNETKSYTHKLRLIKRFSI